MLYQHGLLALSFQISFSHPLSQFLLPHGVGALPPCHSFLFHWFLFTLQHSSKFIEAMDTKEPLSQEPPPGDANQVQPVPVLSPSDQPYYINAAYNITDPILTYHL